MILSFSVTTLLQHLLFVFLLIIAPAWDYYDTRRLQRSPDSPNRIRYYRTVCSWLWICAILACGLVGFRSIFTISPAPEEAGWLFRNIWVFYAVGAVIALFVATIVLPYVTVAWMVITRKQRKYSSGEMLQKVSYAYLFPTNRRERRWWVLVALTAGICEEILFRGFLLHYLHTSPWALSLTSALLLSSVIFGLQHLYQKAVGVITTTIVGAIFGLLFLLSGNLLFPIAFHAALDLRLLVSLRPPVE